MMLTRRHRHSIGVWTEWDSRALSGTGAGQSERLAREGLARLVTFLVEGAAQRGDIKFHFVVDADFHKPIHAMLSNLRAREGVDWVIQSNFADHPSEPPVVAQERVQVLAREARNRFFQFLYEPNRLRRIAQVGQRLFRFLFEPNRLGRIRRKYANLVSVQQPLPPTPSASSRVTNYTSLVDFANAEVEVDGWLLWMPNLINGLRLKGRRVALFPDALPVDFGASYPPGFFSDWFDKVRYTLPDLDNIITFSRHVATRHVHDHFGVDLARIVVVKHAPVDLREDLPVLATDRKRTPSSQKYAAEVLRQHALNREWKYLFGFPFEDVNYVAISTQDRPTKNLPLAVEAVRLLNRRDYAGVKLFTTALVQEGGVGCLLPNALREARLMLDFVSMPDLPKAQHAAFYHCAAVTVVPSLLEGGDTVYPFSESVSVGTPCLMARGPHTEELLESYPELEPWVFDPYDADGLAKLIRETIVDRDRILAIQLASFERMQRRTWADVAGEYADVVVGGVKYAVPR